MRSRTALLVVVAVLTAAALLPLGFVSAHSLQPSAALTANRPGQATTCGDANFLKAVGDDFTAFSAQTKSLNGAAAADMIKASQAITKLRQKYEDMDMSSFAPPCVATRDAVIDLLSNVNDLVILQLGVIADPANKDAYTASIKTQSDRLNTLLQNMASTITGAATPAATS